jgi:hypothetical protein
MSRLLAVWDGVKQSSSGLEHATPRDSGACPFGPVFMDCGRRYDALTTDLVAGRRRQPRQRSTGMPPVAQPQRIDLGAVPSRQPSPRLGGPLRMRSRHHRR